MKKLYVSCPVEGKALLSVLHTVKKMHKIAEVLFDEELEVIDSVSVSELTGTDLHDLSRHIELMAQADYFVYVPDCEDRTVYLETEIASAYNIKIASISAKYVIEENGDING